MPGNWKEGCWFMNCLGNKSTRPSLCEMQHSEALQMTH